MLVSGGLRRTPPGINMPIWPLSHQDIPGFREFPAEHVGECTVLSLSLASCGAGGAGGAGAGTGAVALSLSSFVVIVVDCG